MIGFPVGIVVANVGEWFIHKHILHKRGREPGSYWRFHLDEHHRAASVCDGRDPAYEHIRLEWNAQTKEAVALAAGAVALSPMFPVAPFFTAGIWYSMANYYYVHRRSHLDLEWARKNVPWHVDHHMGPNPECNWCVTKPWTDILLGTRAPYVGTEAEAADRARRAAA